jgi:hypothetical protein
MGNSGVVSIRVEALGSPLPLSAVAIEQTKTEIPAEAAHLFGRERHVISQTLCWRPCRRFI